MSAGAFFDLDGTLVAPPSLERRLLGWLLWRGEVSPAGLARWLGSAARRLRSGAARAICADKSYLAGVRWAAVEEYLFAWRFRPAEIYPQALGRLLWHARQGHSIFLVSGTLAPLARALAAALPVAVEVRATEIEIAGNHLTGKLAGRFGHVNGPAKAAAVVALASRHGLRLDRSYAYGNSSADRWMLEAVGAPVAVNASWRLTRIAQARGWAVVNWRTIRNLTGASRPNLQEDTCLPAK